MPTKDAKMETTEVNGFADNSGLMPTCSQPSHGLGYLDPPLGWTENQMVLLPFKTWQRQEAIYPLGQRWGQSWQRDGGLGGLDVESHTHWAPCYTAPSHAAASAGSPPTAGWYGLLAPTVQLLHLLFQRSPRVWG